MPPPKPRTANQVAPHLIPIHLPTGLPRNAACELCITLIKHILYMRQQIPSTYDQLKQNIRPYLSKPTKEVPSSVKKAHKLINTMDQWFQQLPSLFSRFFVSSVALLLGSSILNPREYFLVVPDIDTSAGPADSKTVQQLNRTMIRQLVMMDHQVFAKELMATRIFLLLNIYDSSSSSLPPPPSTSSTTAAATSSGSRSNDTDADVEMVEDEPVFHPQQRFTLRWKNRKATRAGFHLQADDWAYSQQQQSWEQFLTRLEPQTFHLAAESSSDDDDDEELMSDAIDSAVAVDESENYCWWRARQDAKGFKLGRSGGGAT